MTTHSTITKETIILAGYIILLALSILILILSCEIEVPVEVKGDTKCLKAHDFCLERHKDPDDPQFCQDLLDEMECKDLTVASDSDILEE